MNKIIFSNNKQGGDVKNAFIHLEGVDYIPKSNSSGRKHAIREIGLNWTVFEKGAEDFLEIRNRIVVIRLIGYLDEILSCPVELIKHTVIGTSQDKQEISLYRVKTETEEFDKHGKIQQGVFYDTKKVKTNTNTNTDSEISVDFKLNSDSKYRGEYQKIVYESLTEKNIRLNSYIKPVEGVYRKLIHCHLYPTSNSITEIQKDTSYVSSTSKQEVLFCDYNVKPVWTGKDLTYNLVQVNTSLLDEMSGVTVIRYENEEYTSPDYPKRLLPVFTKVKITKPDGKVTSVPVFKFPFSIIVDKKYRNPFFNTYIVPDGINTAGYHTVVSNIAYLVGFFNPKESKNFKNFKNYITKKSEGDIYKLTQTFDNGTVERKYSGGSFNPKDEISVEHLKILYNFIKDFNVFVYPENPNLTI